MGSERDLGSIKFYFFIQFLKLQGRSLPIANDTTKPEKITWETVDKIKL